jgi:hypothetical protein
MTNNEQRISVGELFTGSFFSIPALLLYNHGYIINSILAWAVFVSSLIYHRHITETNNNPHFLYKIIDVGIVLICWISAIPIAYNHPIIIIFATGVPFFYFIERIYLCYNGNDASLLIGTVGIHMLIHVSGIISLCLIAFKDKTYDIPIEKDLVSISFGILISILFFNIFQPRYFDIRITNKDLRIKICGIPKKI